MHEKPAQPLGEVQPGAGARFHAVPTRIPVRACFVVIAQFLVLDLVDGLFDRCTAFTFSRLIEELS